MKIKILVILSCLGILAGLLSVFVYNEKVAPSQPMAVSFNPFDKGVYASGIIESYQSNGENINIYPEVSGRVTTVYVQDGQEIKKGDPILAIEDSIQREIVAKDQAQMQAALTQLNELKAQPRKENLDLVQAQLDAATANLEQVQAQTEKIQKAYSINSEAISKNDLDNAINALKIAQENVKVAQAQYDLTKAGAWSFDIQNQQNQYQALLQTYDADLALLDKYLIKSPIDGIVLRISATKGGYVSPQGSYDTYTQGLTPVVELGQSGPQMEVRCFLDEILVPRLPSSDKMKATMFIRGQNNLAIPLEFVRIQPYTIPNIELSNARAERVDVRVLPIIFKFQKPKDINLYPGQLVDVFIKTKQ